jgi:hypothetical protein
MANTNPIAKLEKDCKVFKGLYKSQIGLTNYWNNKANTILDKYILLAYNSSQITGESEVFWNIVEEEGYAGFKYNFYTEIRDYVNKKGHMSSAHYVGNKYVGSVKKLGDKPQKKIFYGTKAQAENYINENENYKNKKLKGWSVEVKQEGENKRVVFTPKFRVIVKKNK